MQARVLRPMPSPVPALAVGLAKLIVEEIDLECSRAVQCKLD